MPRPNKNPSSPRPPSAEPAPASDRPCAGTATTGQSERRLRSMAVASETDIQSEILTALRRLGIFVRRNRQYGRGRKAGGLGPGSADLIVCHQGRFIALEVKKPKEKQSDDQREWEAELRRAGGRYYVVTSPGEAVVAVMAV